VDDGDRTHDNRDHNPGLYQLSYVHQQCLRATGAPGRTRTCDPRLRRPMLYPPELRAPFYKQRLISRRLCAPRAQIILQIEAGTTTLWRRQATDRTYRDRSHICDARKCIRNHKYETCLVPGAPACARVIFVVGAAGFEPATLCSQSRCATRLRHAPCRHPDRAARHRSRFATARNLLDRFATETAYFLSGYVAAWMPARGPPRTTS
jgi:hypothetical protein